MISPAREEPCRPPQIPKSLLAKVAGYYYARDLVGESGGAVYRLHSHSNMPDLYLKVGRHDVAKDITAEMERLRWLGQYVRVPEILGFVSEQDATWLLMTALPGKTAFQMLEERTDVHDEIVSALAVFMQRLHAIPASACPFSSNRDVRLAHARKRIDAGLVEIDEFDEARSGWTAQQVWQAMHDLLPLDFDSVVTHGDFSLDNILMQGNEVVGCIDLGRLGIADRYQDIAILWNCLGEFDSGLQKRFLKQYGITDLDLKKLDFHLMLDELF